MNDSSAKAALKAAKAALSRDDALTAKQLSSEVASASESSVSSGLRLTALLMVALACQNLNDPKSAEFNYRKAAALAENSPMPWNGLVALFEKTGDEDALVDALKTLRRVLAESSPFDNKKFTQVSFKLLARLESMEDWIESVALLDSLLNDISVHETLLSEIASHLASEAASESDEKLQLPRIHILKKLVRAQEAHDSETTTRQIDLRRKRLGAADLVTTKRLVEMEVVQASKLDMYYSKLLDELEKMGWTSQVMEVQEKLVSFLSMKIKHVKDTAQKADIVAQLHSISETLVHASSGSEVAFEFLIESSDSWSDEYDIEILELASNACHDKAIGRAATGYLKWKSEEYTADEALDDANESFDLNPSSIFTTHLLATLHNSLKDYDASAVFCKKSSALVSQFVIDSGISLPRVSLSLEFLLASNYAALGPKFCNDAAVLYESVLSKTQGQFVPALLGLASAYNTAGKHAEALHQLHAALRLDPACDAACGEIGWTLFRMHGGPGLPFNQKDDETTFMVDKRTRDVESVQWMRRAAEMNPTSPLHQCRLGKMLYALGETEADRKEAYAHLLASVKLDATSAPGAFTAIGVFCLEVEGNKARAAKCFVKALEVNPMDEEGAVALAKLQLEAGEVDNARTVLTEFASVSPRVAVVWRYLGFICLKNNEFAEAINYFQTSLRLDTKNVVSWEGLGSAYTEEGKYMAALKAFKRASELDPQSFMSIYQSAQIKMKLGLYKDALVEFATVQSAIENGKAAGYAVPCWKSMGECYLAAARDSFAIGAYGICIEELNKSMRVCMKVIQSGRTGYQSVFKILGDACMAYYEYKSIHTSLMDMESVAKGLQMLGRRSGEHDELEGQAKQFADVLQLAVDSYKIALHICGNMSEFSSLNSSYLHDLALAYHYIHELYLDSNIDSSDRFLKMCLSSIRKALHSDPNNEYLWNSLGVFALRVDSKIAQHAFIKAAEFNEKISDPWINLGYFYYFNGDLDLAKQSFMRAQLIDPENCLGWFGHALISAKEDSHDLDLFDHANDLAHGRNPEISFSFALSDYRRYTSSLELDSSVLSDAIFSMTKYCEIRSGDAVGFTLLGLLHESQGMWEQSVVAYSRAVEICRNRNMPELKDCLINYSRGLCSSQRYADAIIVHSELFERKENDDDVLARVGFGLALFFEMRLEESLSCFQTALNVLQAMTEADILLQNKVGVLLSQVLYALGSDVHQALAKNQLMECIQRPGGFPQAIISLLALGIVCGDEALAQGAAAELLKVKPDEIVGLETERNMILSRYFLLQGAGKLSRGFLAKNIHQTPWSAKNWLMLCDNIARYVPEIQESLVTVAKAAVLLQHSNPKSVSISETERASIYQSLGHALLTRSSKRGMNELTSRASFHSAIRANPTDPRMWLSLGFDQRTTATVHFMDPLKLDGIAKAIEIVCQTVVSLGNSTAMEVSWANLLSADSNIVRGVALMASGEEETSRQILQGALDITEVARSDAECPDRRIMSFGFAVGARALFALGEDITAFGAYRNAITCTPESSSLWRELAEAYTGANRLRQAVSSLMAALTVSETDGLKAMAFASLLKLYCIMENGEEALAALSRLKGLEATATLSPNVRLLQIISQLKFGNANANTRAKKMIATVLDEEKDNVWIGWLSTFR